MLIRKAVFWKIASEQDISIEGIDTDSNILFSVFQSILCGTTGILNTFKQSRVKLGFLGIIR